MKLHKITVVFTILITSFSSSLISMDPPKSALDQNIELHWITLIKNILLDKIPLRNESGDALEDQLIMSKDGVNSFQYLTPETQDNIVYLLKLYMTSSSPLGKTPTTIHNTFDIFKDLFKQDEHLKKLFFDPTFCRQLIKLLARKFNEPETVVAANMQLGASHSINIVQNNLFHLCNDAEQYPEREFKKELNKLIKKDADVNFTYFGLKTPLMLIVETEHPSFVRLLIEKGADRSMKNKDGETAQDILEKNWPIKTKNMPKEYTTAFKALTRKNTVN